MNKAKFLNIAKTMVIIGSGLCFGWSLNVLTINGFDWYVIFVMLFSLIAFSYVSLIDVYRKRDEQSELIKKLSEQAKDIAKDFKDILK